MSRSKVNSQKSELLVTSMQQREVSDMAEEINCKSGEFPIRYLGLSLSDKGLKNEHYKFVIDKIQNRLPGWQANILRIAGREVIVNVIMSTTPVYYMTTFLLPK
jgi:hypothetical protein